jgi:hypothetical protein
MGYSPLSPPDASLFDAMREALPIVDAAIDKIVRLTGSCQVECSDRGLQGPLERFVRTVAVGPASRGMDQFVSSYLHSLLTYGSAVGEIVPDHAGRAIRALYNARLSDVVIRPGRSPLEAEICTLKGLSPVPVRYPQLVLFTPLNPPPGELRGTPVLRGLPFVGDILTKIFSSVGSNFERMGNLRYAVTYRPGPGRLDKAQAGEVAGAISQEWARTVSPGGPVRDFVAVGDVDVRVIGADSRMLSTEIPVRQMLEQIVAKLGIPPFMLGLSWSTTERMSAQQADILTSELESYRRLLDPVIVTICEMFLRLAGSSATVRPVWGEINLQDEAEAANIRLIDARIRAIDNGVMPKEGTDNS